MGSHEHPNPNKQDDPSATPIVMVSVVGILIVVAIVIALAGLYYRTESRFVAERVYADTTNPYRTMLEQQRAALSAPPTWVDRENRIARIPIDRAITLVARELAAPPPRPSPSAPPETADHPDRDQPDGDQPGDQQE